MPQIINTNIASLTAQRNLNKSQSANQQALTRLSSGLRINSAKDDAAGLAISTRFTSQIRGLNVAIRNVGDGVSLAQTADGALGTMTDNLQRIRELAIQSANATNSDIDREALQAEVSQLIAEISRTGEQTSFNGIKLLDGNFDATFQIGANVGETVSFGISELTADTLGGGRSAGVSALGDSNALKNGDLVINGVVISSSTAADDSASTSNSAASAIAKVAAINKSTVETGVEATTLTNIAAGTAQQATTGGAASTSGTLTLNGVTFSVATGDVDSSADRSAVITAINAVSGETGVIAIDSGSAAGGVTLEAADGRNIALSFGTGTGENLTAASTGLTSNAVTEGGYTLTSLDGTTPVVVTAGTGSLSNAGLVEGEFAAATAAVNSVSRSSRAEVSSDIGDIGARASSITGGETVNLANANFSAGDASFTITIANATSGFEDVAATVTLNADYRNSDIATLVADINAQFTGGNAIAAEAYVLDGDKLGFRRTSAEAGSLELSAIVSGTTPGGDTTMRAALGLQATDSIGASTTTLNSDTNVERGGVIGRAELVGTDAVAASITSSSNTLATSDFSGGNVAQFDLTIAGATTSSDNGTYTVQVQTDFTNALYSGFATDSADAALVLEEINKDLKNAGAENIIVASFDANDQLVFSRVTQETGGSIAISSYVSSGTTATAQAAAFGLADGKISSDGTATSTVGADAKAAGAADAVGGQLIGVDTDSSLINGGYNTSRSGAFAEFDNSTTTTGIDTASIAAAGFDFLTNNASFDISDGVNSGTISLTTDLTDITGLLLELNTQFDAQSIDITATDNGGVVVFTQDIAGVGNDVTISNVSDTDATNYIGIGAAPRGGLDSSSSTVLGTTVYTAGTSTGDTAVTLFDFSATLDNANFDITDGTNAGTITLDSSAGQAGVYADLAELMAEIQSQMDALSIDITVSSDAGKLAFTHNVDGSNTTAGLSNSVTITSITDGGVSGNLDLGTVVEAAGTNTPGSAATLNGAALVTGFDFSANNVSFDISDGTNTDTITLTTNVTNMAGLIAAIEAQLGGSGGGSGNAVITSSDNSGVLLFTSDTAGGGNDIVISNISDSNATNYAGLGPLTNGGLAGGIDTTGNTGTFAGTQTAGAAAVGFDYSATTVTFDVSDGTNSATVTLDNTVGSSGNVTDIDGLVTAVQLQLTAGSLNITVSKSASNELVFTNNTEGEGNNAVISNISDADGTNNAGLNGVVASSTSYGSTFRSDNDFTYNLGGEDITIDLTAAPDLNGLSYTDDVVGTDGGGFVIAAYINSQSGLTASFDSSTNQFSIQATDGDTDLVLVGGSDNALEYLGLSAGTYSHTAAVTGTETVAAVNLNSLSEGDLKINGITIASSSAADDNSSSSLANSSDKSASGISIAAAINKSSTETGVTASVNATTVEGGSTNIGTQARVADGDQGVIHINGVASSTLSLSTDSETNRTEAISAINNMSGQTGVTAEDAGGYIKLVAADGRNISVAIDNLGTSFTGANIGLSSSQSGIGEADFSGSSTNFAAVAETTASTVTLSSAKEFTIAAGTNGAEGLAGVGLAAGTYGGSENGQFLSDVDISTVEGANAAILALDNAITAVSSQRATLGAIQNRLESTVGNLTVTAENLTAANSRILDADFAVETAELSRSQVLQQAGISILAQANAQPQQVLSLLQ